jgi:hypothetical protein
MKWLGWAVQNPHLRAEVAIVLRGKRGTGKGLLGNAMVILFGGHAVHISNASHLAGKFNEHMRNTCMFFADEAYWPGDKSAEGTLKRLITEYFLFIEPKFRGAFMARNMLHIIMAANEDWPIPAGEHERRFEVYDVSDEKMQQNETYFKPIFRQLEEEGGYEAMLWDLQHMELGDFHPRDNPKSGDALLDIQKQSLDPWDAWWVQLLEDGQLEGNSARYPHRAISLGYEKTEYTEWKDKNGEMQMGRRTTRVRGLLDQAHDIEPRLKRFGYCQMARYLEAEERGCKSVDKVRLDDPNERRRGWEFPPLPVARAAWEKRYPGSRMGLCSM